MGIAASQARYLSLTARKSNVEFQGQQVNQARTNLANESANIYNEMMMLKTPIVPSVYDYYDTKAAFTAGTDDQEYYVSKYTKIDGGAYDANGNGRYEVTFQYSDDANKTFQYFVGEADLTFDGESNIPLSVGNIDTSGLADPKAIAINNLSPSIYSKTVYDQAAYDEALNAADVEKAAYEQRIQELHARTEKLQIEDRTLELQLRQLDTEQDALQTELDTVKKVIQENVEKVFKTFQD